MEEKVRKLPVIAFNESVDVFFFDQEEPTSHIWGDQFRGRLKEFDGRSNSSMNDDCFLDNMCIPSIKLAHRGRERSYHWHAEDLLFLNDNSDDSESTKSDDDVLWIMENMPCDCDLLDT